MFTNIQIFRARAAYIDLTGFFEVIFKQKTYICYMNYFQIEVTETYRRQSSRFKHG